MKIAFLTPEYPHPKTGSSGGIGTSIKNLAMGLLAEGCSVRVLVYAQKEEGVFYDNGICIQQIRNVKFKGLSWYLTRKKLENIINTLYDNKEIDLVEAPDWTGITSFVSPKKCPVVIRLHGSDTYFCHLDQRPVKWINRFHEKRALKNADGLLSVSQFTADTTNEVFHLDKKFSIIPNGIDMKVFSNSNSYNNGNGNGNGKNNNNVNGNSNNSLSNKNKNTILYFGSLIRKKGLLELPFIFNAVLAKKPEAKLILVGKDVPDIISGNSSTWQMMQGLFSPASLLNVSYLGAVPYDEIKNQISSATVCVFPTFAEALPVSWIEAMALEQPIVASNIGWAPEVIDDGVNGFLVHPKDHLHYAAKIIHLMEDGDLQKEFGLGAKKKVSEKFSVEKVAQQSLVFYKNFYNK
jgi:glycosyltransferase involved in cell wall biosynthesis